MATKKSPVKLLFFSPYFYPYISGLTQYPYRLFTESGLTFDVTCLTFRHERRLESRDIINHLSTKIIVNRMPFWFRISKGFISPQSLSYFWREIKRNDTTLLNLPSIEGLPLAFFTKLSGKPLISLLHCEVLLPFSLVNCIVNFILNCGVWIQLALSDTILIYTKDYYEKKFMYSFFQKKMKVVLPPVNTSPPDLEYLSSLQTKTKNYSHVIGFCGRIASEKGVEVLISALFQIKDTILLFAGPTGKDVVGENTYFERIEKLLAKKQIPHIFLGTLSDGKLSAFYKAIDVLTLPSLNKTEAFGMVQVEAMLQGTPVIASNLPGVRVPIHMTKMGIVVEPGNIDGLKNAILTVLTNRLTYTNLHLIHKAKTLFDSQKTYDVIYNVISTEVDPPAGRQENLISHMNKVQSIIKTYLQGRPAFYAYLRPQEAILFYERIQKMKGPILDFGCGDGFFAQTIFKKRAIDVGLDLSSSRIAQAPATKIYKKLVEYDGIRIPYRAGTFGTIISNCVFEHIPNIKKSVNEMHRVTKKGGLLMTTVMCSSWSKNLWGRKLFGKKYVDWFNGIQHHDSLLSKKEWTSLFKKAGFEIVESIDYLYEEAAHKTELYHYLSIFSLFTYMIFKRWQLLPFVSNKRVAKIQSLIESDTKNPSACFFVLKKI